MKALTALVVLAAFSWMGLWLTPDQQGQRLMQREEYEAAARTFRDPMRQGIAWFRAGEFEKAEQTFARLTSAEAEFNRGNCLVMRGKYEDAIQRYDSALDVKPGWEPAQTNREIARLRAERVKKEGGDMGQQEIGADEITFDKKKNSEGQDTEVDSSQAVTDSSMQAIWLRRVQTKPAQFLKNKFAYQISAGAGQEGDQ